MNKHYDYIICGAGCAGLSLAYRLCSKEFSDKKILLIEKDQKDKNDRSWCFWEKGNGIFESIIHKSWDHLNIYANKYQAQLNISPFQYKMIRGIDFYEFCLDKIKKSPNIEMIDATIQNIKSHKNGTSVITNIGIYTSDYTFTSIFNDQKIWNKSPYLLQHFRGWFVKSEKPIFQSHTANFMDFRTDQANETCFFYVLPTNENEALVELAVLSQKPWESQYYDVKISTYLKSYFDIEEYEILETENGIIPMTSYPFEKNNTSKCIHIGTAGGMVKASTGFAFARIQKHSEFIANQLKKGLKPIRSANSYQNKYRWYDKVLLKVLTQNHVPSELIFERLFRKNLIQDVLDFLNEESSWTQELKILSAPPKWPFIRAALNL